MFIGILCLALYMSNELPVKIVITRYFIEFKPVGCSKWIVPTNCIAGSKISPT